jgi:hypothetical protein
MPANNRCICSGAVGADDARGRADYGTRCARWDAPDEEPWCAVATAGACGEGATFSAAEGRFWSHAACGGEGDAFVPPGPSDSATAKAKPPASPPASTLLGARSRASMWATSGAHAADVATLALAAADDASRARAAAASRAAAHTGSSSSSSSSSGGGGGGSSGGGSSGGPRLRGAVVYLLTYGESAAGQGYFADLLLSMRCAYKFYARRRQFGGESTFSYPFVVFVQSDDALPGAAPLPAPMLARLRANVPRADVRVVPIAFDFPRSIARNATFLDAECRDVRTGENRWAAARECGCTCVERCWHLNYLHMNRFRTLGQWGLYGSHPALRDLRLEYYLSVDVDTFLQGELPLDPFALMAERGCVFVTGDVRTEYEGCFEGQAEATLAWAAKAGKAGDGGAGEGGAGMTAPAVTDAGVAAVKGLMYGGGEMGSPTVAAYWGGLNAGRIPFFASAAHKAYADHINERGEIYTRRWNDQVHFPLAIALLSGGSDRAVCSGVDMLNQRRNPLLVHEHGASSHMQAVVDKCAL